MRRHPARGLQILVGIPFLEKACHLDFAQKRPVSIRYRKNKAILIAKTGVIKRKRPKFGILRKKAFRWDGRDSNLLDQQGRE
jgi:hypothetical protein